VSPIADQPPASEPERFAVRATTDSHFGWLRTRLALERTIMAWLRTAVSLIGFGFAIVQFFDRLDQLPGARPAYQPHAAVYLGLALIACGVLSLLISIRQYFWTARYLSHGSFAAIAGMGAGLRSPVLGVAVLLIGIGVFAFSAVLLRMI
jgi:putative membrane protein